MALGFVLGWIWYILWAAMHERKGIIGWKFEVELGKGTRCDLCIVEKRQVCRCESGPSSDIACRAATAATATTPASANGGGALEAMRKT